MQDVRTSDNDERVRPDHEAARAEISADDPSACLRRMAEIIVPDFREGHGMKLSAGIVQTGSEVPVYANNVEVYLLEERPVALIFWRDGESHPIAGFVQGDDGHLALFAPSVGELPAHDRREYVSCVGALECRDERGTIAVKVCGGHSLVVVGENAVERELVYGLYPNSSDEYFVALYDAAGIPMVKETGISIGRVSYLLGNDAAAFIASDRGSKGSDDYPPNYRFAGYVGTSPEECRNFEARYGRAMATSGEPQRPALNDAQREALVAFRDKQGRLWKSRLLTCWRNGNYTGVPKSDAPLLQQIRNQFGPEWLHGVDIERFRQRQFVLTLANRSQEQELEAHCHRMGIGEFFKHLEPIEERLNSAGTEVERIYAIGDGRMHAILRLLDGADVLPTALRGSLEAVVRQAGQADSALREERGVASRRYQTMGM